MDRKQQRDVGGPGVRWVGGLGIPRYPSAGEPPSLPADPSGAGFRAQRRYVLYQMQALKRLRNTPHLAETDRDGLREREQFIRELLCAHPLLDDLARCIHDTDKWLCPRLLELRDLALAKIREEPTVSSRAILAIFVGRLRWMDRRFADRHTAREVIDRCTAFRCLVPMAG